MKTKFPAGWLLPVIFAFICAGCAGLSHRVVAIHFDASEVGTAPRDFTTTLTGGGGPVLWVVRDDPKAPEGGPVLVQESADNTVYRFPLCVYDKFTARDAAAEVKYKAISGKVDEAGGIVLRYTPGNYYIARANALENNVILFKTVNGKRSHVQEVPVPVAKGIWHTLRFEARGEHLKIMFDGKTVLERDDTTFTNPGQAGLWTKADSVSAFTDFKIERLP